jgi:hypothetical protein
MELCMDSMVVKSLNDARAAVREAHEVHALQNRLIGEYKLTIEIMERTIASLERTVATKDEIIARLLRSN